MGFHGLLKTPQSVKAGSQKPATPAPAGDPTPGDPSHPGGLHTMLLEEIRRSSNPMHSSIPNPTIAPHAHACAPPQRPRPAAAACPRQLPGFGWSGPRSSPPLAPSPPPASEPLSRASSSFRASTCARASASCRCSVSGLSRRLTTALFLIPSAREPKRSEPSDSAALSAQGEQLMMRIVRAVPPCRPRNQWLLLIGGASGGQGSMREPRAISRNTQHAHQPAEWGRRSPGCPAACGSASNPCTARARRRRRPPRRRPPRRRPPPPLSERTRRLPAPRASG